MAETEIVIRDKDDTWRGPIKFGCLALFVNGIVLAVAFGMTAGFREFGGKVIFPLLFVSIFALVGLWLLWKFLREAAVIWSLGQSELILPRAPLRMGEKLRVSYRREIRRSSVSPRRVEAVLACVESATYTVGTDTRTVTEKVHETTLAPIEIPARGASQASAGVPFVAGGWEIAIPKEGPPSFAAHWNKIEWRLVVTLRLEGAPDDDSTFLIPVGIEAVP